MAFDSKKWREEENKRYEEHKRKMAEKYLPDVAVNITDAAYERAWEAGHSAGYEEVENWYIDYAGLVKEVLGR